MKSSSRQSSANGRSGGSLRARARNDGRRLDIKVDGNTVKMKGHGADQATKEPLQ
jgi:hypothetical protein